MNWNSLTTDKQLEDLLAKSNELPQVIFKHSTRCGISKVVKNRLDRAAASASADFYFLDLITYRSLSNKIASDLGIEHESPQVLLVSKGKCIYNESHYGITVDDLEAEMINV